MERGIYHMTWDFQGRNWQAGRREEGFLQAKVRSKSSSQPALGETQQENTRGRHKGGDTKGETQRGRHKGGDTKGNKTENPKTKKIEK